MLLADRRYGKVSNLFHPCLLHAHVTLRPSTVLQDVVINDLIEPISGALGLVKVQAMCGTFEQLC